MLKYELGEMKSADGSSLKYEVEAKASDFAIRISRMIEATSIYKELSKKLPSPRVILYFQHVVKKEIYPYVREACVIQWHKRNDRPLETEEGVLRIPRYGISKLLENCWNFKDVPIKSINLVSLNPVCVNLLRKLIRNYAKKLVISIMDKMRFNSKENYSLPARSKSQGIIVCHYGEGLDSSKRNNMDWYLGSGINPERILIYFNDCCNTPFATKRVFQISKIMKTGKIGRLIKKEIIQEIEKKGFGWVSLRKDIVESPGQLHYWQAPPCPKRFLIKKNKEKNFTEKWIIEISNDLLKQVYYWHAFHNHFNVRINYISEQGLERNIAQAIAFDIDEKKQGILVSKQRSEIFLPVVSFLLGHHPKHLFFTWSKRVQDYLKPNCEKIMMLIVTGCHNVISPKQLENNDNYSLRLRKQGVNFVITLFDNISGPDLHFSQNQMTGFYRAFLQWVLDDKDVGLIIKSKNPQIISNLSLVHSIFNATLKSGRCFRIDEVSNLPINFSIGADIVIGCGISSPLIEAVAGGGRAIHYDTTYLKRHEFYGWGYERIIFDNLERLMSALKRYKKDPKSKSALGDWSLYADKLDPFRDGRGAERIGIYMRWLLESFDEGKSRHEVIQYANKLYVERWGKDKVIDMKHSYS